jgi:hypothetical protein
VNTAYDTTPASPSCTLHEPLWRFCGSHADIGEGLQRLAELPVLAEALRRAREEAAAALKLFEEKVVGHHVDEEQELFEAVTRSARGTDDEARVDALVSRLTSEHRVMEQSWCRIRPGVLAVAAGKPQAQPGFDEAIAGLVDMFREHARMEEEVFLPLADRILTRNPNHMAALDLSLYIRHVPAPRLAYV